MRGRLTGRTLKGATGQPLRRSGRFRDSNRSFAILRPGLGPEAERLRQPSGPGSVVFGQHGEVRLFQLLPRGGAGRASRLGNRVEDGLFADFAEEVGRGGRKPLPHVQLQGLCQIVGMAQGVGVPSAVFRLHGIDRMGGADRHEVQKRVLQLPEAPIPQIGGIPRQTVLPPVALGIERGKRLAVVGVPGDGSVRVVDYRTPYVDECPRQLDIIAQRLGGSQKKERA
jgi:hypothetical protein